MRRADPGPGADRTRASPLVGPEPLRRANPGVRLSFASVRLRAGRGPIRARYPDARERTRTASRPPRSNLSARPSEPERPAPVRRGSTSCGTGPGVPGAGPPANDLSKSTLNYRESGPARSPDLLRRGAAAWPRSNRCREAGPGTGPRPSRNRGLPQSNDRSESERSPCPRQIEQAGDPSGQGAAPDLGASGREVMVAEVEVVERVRRRSSGRNARPRRGGGGTRRRGPRSGSSRRGCPIGGGR